MFGWEFPPKIYGGLAVASYGITKGLSLQGDVATTFCMPKPTGKEEKFLKIVIKPLDYFCHGYTTFLESMPRPGGISIRPKRGILLTNFRVLREE